MTRPLFSPVELFDGFDPDDVGSYQRTLDFRIYLATKRPSTKGQRVDWAEQDQWITEARDHFLTGQRCVAIMGGHKVSRNEPTYAVVARLARTLARAGIIVTGGGGPGAMEATQLGAAVAPRSMDTLDDAIAHLSVAAEFPSGMGGVLRLDGSIVRELIDALHAWQAPVFTLLAGLAADGPLHQSMSVPTWFYGHEPPTPFATHIAKYVSNALREDGLLAIASQGVVYGPGQAGTLQEVFQDAAQNAYRTHGWFSPMCFLDTSFAGIDHWWSEQYPVASLLRPLFGQDLFDRHVLITPDADEIADFLLAFTPPVDSPLPS